MKKYILRKESDSRTHPIHYTLDYQAELNESQYRVVTTFEGPLLVVAGAGSGKTRTLTYRVARMVESGIPPESILLLTFTRKAAQEMLRRAATLLDSRCQRVAGGTFHSFANMILRRYAHVIGFQSGFTILDQGDSEDVISLLREQLGLNKQSHRFPNKSTIQTIFSKAVNKVMSVQQIVEKYYSQFAQDLDDLNHLYTAYKTYKASHQIMDYDDLLIYFQQLLEQHQQVRDHLSQVYRYIMVDEYQDTNKIQAKIVQLLASTHNNVMAVGDEAQSIYSFRGANYRNIIEFPEQFPGTTIIKLEENYRSRQPILDLTNAVIKQARDSFQKRLFTKQDGGPRPVLITASTEHQQSQFVAQRILELREEGIPLSEIAVLFRSSYHSFDLELELNKRNIPFVKVGGFKFIEAAHIKDLLAHLRVLVNPLDAISWHRILLLIEGIGPKTCLKITQQLQEQNNPFAYLAAYPKKTKPTLELQRLGATLEKIMPLSPPEQVQQLLEYYTPILRNKYDNYPKREQDLEQFRMITERFRDLESFLSEITLEPPSRSVNDVLQVNEDEECLVLSTIHSAKGLEWHTVFVIWLLDGRFPSMYAAYDEEAMEEELRLLYVAATRAMKHLYLSYPVYYDSRSGIFFSKPSRFLDKIPDHYLDRWSLVEEDIDGWETLP
jgi:DNA helicase-2/ATP-dependent DNA helicase PcrA